MKTDEMILKINADPLNENFARSTVAAFCARLNPTMEEIGDIKTAVSEAVTNCVVHAYEYGGGEIEIITTLKKGCVFISVSDKGRGIKDVEAAMQPFYTTGNSDERSGMGFTVMAAFTDELSVWSEPEKGTVVKMKKFLKSAERGKC